MSDFAARAKAIVAALRTGEPSSVEIFEAFGQLDALPTEAVRAALAAWVGPLPDLDQLDTATRLAHGLPLPPLRLRTLVIDKDADILDLGPVAEDQVRLAGLSWDGHDRPAEERLDGEIEGSFAGTLERRVLADAEAQPPKALFDVVLFADDAGVVFAAGTSRIVAMIAYRKVEMRDRRTRLALEAALTAPGEAIPAAARKLAAPVAARAPVTPTPPAREASPPAKAAAAGPIVAIQKAPAATKAQAKPTKVAAKSAKAPAKTSAAKSTSAKRSSVAKSTASKAPAKKAPTKKSGATKSIAKKPPAKKATAKAVPKKAAAKKVAATKPTGKKPAAKKAGAKKASPKKPAAKKAAAKKAKKKAR